MEYTNNRRICISKTYKNSLVINGGRIRSEKPFGFFSIPEVENIKMEQEKELIY